MAALKPDKTGGRSRKSRSAPLLGMVEWFRPGEHGRVEEALRDLRTIGVSELRTGLSWAEWHTRDGKAWYDWLLPRLAEEVNVLLNVLYTPPSLGIVPSSASPPRRPRDYADFIDTVITRYGGCFEYLEFWNEPNNLNDWDFLQDPHWFLFCEMVGSAAYWARQRGKRTVLAGTCPSDPNWLRLMCERGVVRYIDAVGLHGFPGTWDFAWSDWGGLIAGTREVLDGFSGEFGHTPAIWVTETGYSTWRHDDLTQMTSLTTVMDAPVERVYWYSLHDLHPDLSSQEGFHEDERHYHTGLKTASGQPKLLYRMLAEQGPAHGTRDSLEAVRRTCRMCSAVATVEDSPPPGASRPRRAPVLITGGAGFIGCNLADRLLGQGHPVTVLDNLSRPGVERNLRWLKDRHGDKVTASIGDVRNRYALRQALAKVDHVYHLAAQVAVTTSLADPRHDFEVNVGGTLNLLEEIRQLRYPPTLVFASTNKVYGNLGDVPLVKNCTRYHPTDPEIATHGVNEDRSLDFHSPYGCSKGAADQYVIDYARSFGLPAVVFRMSCIYGPRQFGTEDQGWVAHFLIRAFAGQTITLFGDGCQVRDLLYAGDLVDAYLAAVEHMDAIKGSAFNLGGGTGNTSSLLELLQAIREQRGIDVLHSFDDWRRGDQPYYVSDIRKFSDATGWAPRVGFPDGLGLLSRWIDTYCEETAN